MGRGKPDLVVTGKFADTVHVLSNRGHGTFAPAVDVATGHGPLGVVVADLDGDGRADMAVTNTYADTVSVLSSTCP